MFMFNSFLKYCHKKVFGEYLFSTVAFLFLLFWCLMNFYIWCESAIFSRFVLEDFLLLFWKILQELKVDGGEQGHIFHRVDSFSCSTHLVRLSCQDGQLKSIMLYYHNQVLWSHLIMQTINQIIVYTATYIYPSK